MRPKVVLIEGLSDTDELVPHITGKGRNRRSRSWPTRIRAGADVVYPLARYSPNIRRSSGPRRTTRGSSSSTCLPTFSSRFQDVEQRAASELRRRGAEAEPSRRRQGEPPRAELEPRDTERRGSSIYERIADSSGEPDYETYWERRFEHNTSDHSYRLAATQLGQALRELEEDRPRWRAENLVREAFMRRRIER